MRRPGLDADGFIAREGDLARVPAAFAPVVAEARSAVLETFGPRRLHSAYLYGSVPRATAVVMPRWGGWTSDLGESAAVFGRYYPARRAQMRAAAEAGRAQAADRPLLAALVGDLGPWLAAEYARVHGRKAPRDHSSG